MHSALLLFCRLILNVSDGHGSFWIRKGGPIVSNITDYISPESCKSLPGLFLARVSRNPDGIAYRFYNKMAEKWQATSWLEMAQSVGRWRKALLQEGLEPGSRVAIHAAQLPGIATRPGGTPLGLIVVPLYANDRAENIAYILQDTETKILLCPGPHYRQHLSPLLDRLSSLQRVLTIGFFSNSQ